MPALRPAAFLDRDGVINLDAEYVARVEDFRFVDGVLEACRSLAQSGYALVVVTNQSGIGRGYYTLAQFDALCDWMRATFAAAGAPLAGIYHCPHHPSEALPPWRLACDCRKPAPGMLLAAAADLGLDLAASVLFGDRPSDLQAARAAGVPRRVLLGKDGLALPPEPSDPGLATARARSLTEAVGDPAFATARQPVGAG